jgi:hypothetical protein
VNTWHIGEGVIVRYGTNAMVRITPETSAEGIHQFQVCLLKRYEQPRKVLQTKTRQDLSSALRLGEEWIP